MESKRYEYSSKCIPIAEKEEYMNVLITRTEQFIRNLRWKAFFFKNKSSPSDKNTYGFKSQRTAKQDKDLYAFEKDLWELISNLQFGNQNIQQRFRQC